MKGFVQDIEDLAIKNGEFRRVLYTARNCQLVVMALKPTEEIGMEVHKLDQFLRVEEGAGEAVLDGMRTAISRKSTKRFTSNYSRRCRRAGLDTTRMVRTAHPALSAQQ
jgi:mannose-6-phosphate isomerase-like protein (cupin superfamily)